MEKLIDKGMIICAAALSAVWQGGEKTPVVSVLIAITAAAADSCFTGKKQKICGIVTAFILCFFVPQLYLFLPVFFYECVEIQFWGGAAGLVFLLLYHTQLSSLQTALFFLLSAGAMLLAMRTERMLFLEQRLIRLRDTDTELALVLKEKNKSLVEKQDNEIYMATLKERNRIAREIHDNVGHMLSRSLLQVGALLAICKEDAVKEQLGMLRETLGLAMNNIRESVHDLHDDSVDLNQAVLEILKPVRADYDVSYRYDMGKAIPRNVKYCFLSAVKEAISNTIRHSDADRIIVTMIEHPVFFQLKIEDNGLLTEEREDFEKKVEEKLMRGDGMGLSNMRARVDAMHGTFRASFENGFRIFISIPKTDGHVEKG